MQANMIQDNNHRLDGLWEEYKGEGSLRAREELILQFSPLVKVCAGQIGSSRTSLQEREAWGILGLIEAIDRYDPGYGTKFEYYASCRIKGAIIDGMRQEGYINQSLLRKAKKIDEALYELGNKLGRLPDDEELAEHLNLSIGELGVLTGKISQGIPMSLDMPISTDESENLCLIDTIPDTTTSGVEDEVTFNEIKDVLVKALERLGEKERMVITLYYYEGFTLKEIGDTIGLSESRISQIHTKAIFKMRVKLPRK